VLHEGPVPREPDEELRRTRARFIASAGWVASEAEVLRDLLARDGALEALRAPDEIVLWFEHDLFDQLQLVQILARLAGREDRPRRLGLVCIDRHPAIERFRGLGQLGPDRFPPLLAAQRREVQVEVLEYGRRTWEAFCGDDPRELAARAAEPCPGLEFLPAAVARFLEQYPAEGDGLSRSERQILACLEAGERRLDRLFEASQIECEECPFMGDWSFLGYVRELAAAPAPLLRPARAAAIPVVRKGVLPPAAWQVELDLTDEGRAVLAGSADRIAVQGIDRWLGGVHLAGRRVAWRYGRRGSILAGG
jgi:hypothetical protein